MNPFLNLPSQDAATQELNANSGYLTMSFFCTTASWGKLQLWRFCRVDAASLSALMPTMMTPSKGQPT